MTTDISADGLIRENEKRLAILNADYDPVSGKGAPGKREELKIDDHPIPVQWIPVKMTGNKLVKKLHRYGSIRKFYEAEQKKHKIDDYDKFYERILTDLSIVRIRHDFTYWAFMCARIKPKTGGNMIPFKLNNPQIMLLNELEEMRLSETPIRLIICKARQWGGSTMVQIYMAWIQLCHMKGWYSTIVAQTKTTSARILAMYEKLIGLYPSWALDIGETKLQLSSYSKGSANDYAIKDNKGKMINDTVIQVGTVQEPDNIRGGDVALIHYSEVGVWRDTPQRRPEDLIRSLSGGLLYRPYTMEVLESTPKGTGNFFHREWVRAKKGESNRKPFFVPWYTIAHDSLPVDDYEEFARWLLECRGMEANPEGWLDEGRYYWWLWEKGATFEGINWYRNTRKSLSNHSDMASEAPSDDIEAFESTGAPVFDKYEIEALRKGCRSNYMVGEVASWNGADSGEECLKELHLEKDPKGSLKVWDTPEAGDTITNRYLAVVDIGGRWEKADYSVITVFDRFPMMIGGLPEVVAEWRGHTYHDTLAWKAAQIASYYHNALLVVESNTLETKDKNRDTEGNNIDYILDLISQTYPNLYAREKGSEDINRMGVTKWGFHTNTHTKPMVIHNLIAFVRDCSWVERNALACDELCMYEKKENGTFGAVDGQHDDMVMTRAIGLYLCYHKMDMPTERKMTSSFRNKKYSEATF